MYEDAEGTPEYQKERRAKEVAAQVCMHVCVRACKCNLCASVQKYFSFVHACDIRVQMIV